ncbi:hypothetical protein EGT74_24415 [Chitinophaga lutea]|uniref:Uncharacterized protein n=1 Tax=Chitinophaga lutea TaxID=2488634 RepID=A0A3N4PL02_9BACT|nr:hypothetical protein EGT74_24415 [Chitinophaga lutea]
MSTYLEYRLKLKNEGLPPKDKKIHRTKPYSDKREKINREYAKMSRPVWEPGVFANKKRN